MSKRVAVYLRQSQDRSGEGLGIDRQRADVLRVVEARGWTVVAEFIDNDVSAISRKPRPAFNEMMRRIDAGEFDIIAARHMDRLMRRIADLEALLARCDSVGARILTTEDGVDTSTDGGRLVARLLSSVAQGEVERKSARQRSAVQQAANQGRWIGGRRPFGYERDGVTIRGNEAALVEQGYADTLAGESLAEIARRWTAAGFGTPQGRTEWTRAGVKDVLTNPRHAGLRRYRPQEDRAEIRRNPELGITGRAEWAGIVDETTWRAAVRILCDRSRWTGGRGSKGLLTGVAICGVCEAPVHRGGAAHRKPMYRCSSGKHVSRMSDPIDNYVEGLVVARLQRRDALLLWSSEQPDVAELMAEADAIRKHMKDIAQDWGERMMDRDQFHIANRKAGESLAEVESAIAAAGAVSPLSIVASEDIEASWAGLSTATRRGIIEALMTPVIHLVGAGKRHFDRASVEVRWKSWNTA